MLYLANKHSMLLDIARSVFSFAAAFLDFLDAALRFIYACFLAPLGVTTTQGQRLDKFYESRTLLSVSESAMTDRF